MSGQQSLDCGMTIRQKPARMRSFLAPPPPPYAGQTFYIGKEVELG